MLINAAAFLPRPDEGIFQMKTKIAMAGLLAMLTLTACQSGPDGPARTGGGGTFASAMSEVEAGQTAVLLWVQGIACPF